MNGRRSIRIVGFLVALGAFAFGGEGLAREQEIVLEKVRLEDPLVTLEQALQIALRRNPDIDASKWTTYVNKAQITQAQSGYMPQLSGEMDYQRGYYPIDVTGTGLRQDFNEYTMAFAGNQYIYGFGKVAGQVRGSKQQYIASRKDLDKTMAEVVRSVSNAYYEVLKRQELVTVNQEAVSTQMAHLEQARAFFKRGIRPKVDVTKAEVSWAEARLKLIEAEYNLQLAVVNLEKILGGPPVDGPYLLAGVPVQVRGEGSVDPLIETALSARPEVQSRKAQIRAAQAGHDAAWAQFWPTLYGTGQWGWLDTTFPLQNAWLVGAKLTWDFFPGLQTVGEVRQAKATVSVLQAQLRQVELQVIQEVSQAYLMLSEAAQSIATSELALEYARENMDQVQGRYRAGVADAIEFDDAVLSLTEARSDVIQYRYAYLQSEVDLVRAVGVPYEDIWEAQDDTTDTPYVAPPGSTP